MMIPFILGAIGVFALIQFIVSRKRFQTLKNFYLLSAVLAFGSLIVLTRIVLGVGEGLITKLAKYFSDEQNSVFGLIALYGILLISIIIFVLIFGLITKHKSEYIGKISDDVSRIATMLKDKSELTPLYTLLYTMPGIPAVYYGSEYDLCSKMVIG